MQLISTIIITCTSFIFHARAGFDVDTNLLDDGIFAEEFEGNVRYEQCGGLKPVIVLNQFESNPSQFFIPQNASVSVDFSIARDLVAPISVEIKLSKHVPFVGYIRLPCIARYGSCTFKHGCEIMETYPESSFEYQIVCPKWLRAAGIKCKCPFQKGHYAAHNVTVAIRNSIVPKWIAKGDYKTVVIFEDAKGTVGCFKFQFRLL